MKAVKVCMLCEMAVKFCKNLKHFESFLNGDLEVSKSVL